MNTFRQTHELPTTRGGTEIPLPRERISKPPGERNSFRRSRRVARAIARSVRNVTGPFKREKNGHGQYDGAHDFVRFNHRRRRLLRLRRRKSQ